MFGTVLLRLLVFSVALHMVACGHEFFHVPSAITLQPGGALNAHSNFGLSLGHWDGSLIVGSPTSDLLGDVYKCPTKEENILDNKLECSVLTLKISPYQRDISPNQNFYLGASITSTKDYLFTCAPLLIKNVTKLTDKEDKIDAVGSCSILYSNNTSTFYSGPGERYMNGVDDESNTQRFSGGTGWTTLADEDNGLLIIAKTSVIGEIYWIPISEPLKTVTPLSDTWNKGWNIGYGITAGNFFSKKTVYAFSMQTHDRLKEEGKIVFVEVLERDVRDARHVLIGKKKELKLMTKGFKQTLAVTNEAVGAMFGYALDSADLDRDGHTELLVGAPLQSEDRYELEYGALHIYLGKKLKSHKPTPMMTIFGVVPGGRFGTTIASKDIDKDGIPEIFVSAPYESRGVVYILSGHELITKMAGEASTREVVSKFEYSQKVTMIQGEQNMLGFSLKAVPDMDQNGCEELAIGAPGATSVLLLRCLQTVRVAVTSKLKETVVKVADSSFIATVCLKIICLTGSKMSGNLIVTNKIDGPAKLQDPVYTVDLSTLNDDTRCQDMLVEIKPNEDGKYILRTHVEIESTTSLNPKDFKKSWVKLSTDSKTDCTLEISRTCKTSDSDCSPHLSLDVKWRNESAPDNGSKKDIARPLYEVESSKNETISIVVRNSGYLASNGPCVVAEVKGATASRADKCVSNAGQIECMTVNPFSQTDSDENKGVFEVMLDMKAFSNLVKELVVTARLYENCKQNDNITQEKMLIIEYKFSQAWKKLALKGEKHDFQVTDKQITHEELQKKSIFRDDQPYMVKNGGSVTWHNINAVIVIEKRPFIRKVGVSNENCSISDDEHHHKISCILTLERNTTRKIMAWTEMSGEEIGVNLNQGLAINITSQMSLCMDSCNSSKLSEIIRKDLVTGIMLAKDSSFMNSPLLIVVAVLAALLILALITYCLYKKGFFKRNEKKKLDVLRESVRRRSIRLASVKSRPSHISPSTADDDDHIDIEVVDDSPFEEVPIDTKDNVVLINSHAEVHGAGSDGDDKKIQ